MLKGKRGMEKKGRKNFALSGLICHARIAVKNLKWIAFCGTFILNYVLVKGMPCSIADKIFILSFMGK